MSAIEFRDELLEKGWPDDIRVAELADEAPGPEATTFAIRAQAVNAGLNPTLNDGVMELSC